jgi:hypothetical protein
LIHGADYFSTLVDNPALASDSIPVLDTYGQGIQKLSAQAVASSAALSGVSFTDGRKSTQSITVNSIVGLTALVSSNTITITSNTATSREWISLNGTVFAEPQDWDTDPLVAGSSGTAQSIVNAINGSASSASFVATRSGNTVTIFTRSSGTYLNTYTLESSTTALRVANATFINGRDPAQIRINDTVLYAGVHWSVGASAALTAQSISNAVTSYVPAVTSTHSLTVVYATSTAINENDFTIGTSTQAALTIYSPSSTSNGSAQGNFGGGRDTDISGSAITKANSFSTGFPVFYNTSGGSVGGLTNGATYYVSAPTAAQFKLASTRVIASTGGYITTGFSVSTGTVSGTVTPTVYGNGAPASFKFQRSNDGSNWLNISISSMTVNTSTSTGFDFGDANFRYYRAYFTPSDFGATNLKINLSGK